VTSNDEEHPDPAWLVSPRGPARREEALRARIETGPE